MVAKASETIQMKCYILRDVGNLRQASVQLTLASCVTQQWRTLVAVRGKPTAVKATPFVGNHFAIIDAQSSDANSIIDAQSSDANLMTCDIIRDFNAKRQASA